MRAPSLRSNASLVLLCAVAMAGCASGRRWEPEPAPELPPLPAGIEAPVPGDGLAQAESAAMRGDTRRARELASQLPRGSGDPVVALRLQALRARIELLDGHPHEALRQLPPDSAHVPRMAPYVEELRARAQFEVGDPVGAVRTLVERSRYLVNPAEQARNNDLIWNGLGAAQVDAGALGRAAGHNPVVRGWIELALLARDGADEVLLDGWRGRYPEHPGSERLGLLAPVARLPVPAAPSMQYTPVAGGGAIALLLPLSGSFAATGEAVRDGFLSAYYRDGGQQAVRVYDVGGTQDTALAAYQRALSDGAGFVVGPLRKESVAAIAARGQPPAPVLALNYLDDPRAAPFNFFQFGLAPEDEARAAAEHAAARGLRRAVAFVPSTDWGERVLAAFERRLQEQGGQVLASARYLQGGRDFSAAVAGLMRIEASEERHRALVATLGAKSEFESRRRDDVDFIFFAARPQEARLIWPQFRFNRATDLPAYATAGAYDGGAAADLFGLRFCDMPWMLTGAQGSSSRAEPLAAGASSAVMAARAEAAELASAKAQPRLFAFGLDAYNLVARISSGGVRGDDQLPGATGQLQLGNGVVVRQLACAQIQQGGIKLVGPGSR